MPNTEERTAKIEGVMGQMDKRLGNIEGEVVRIHTRVDQVITQTNEGFKRVNTRFDQVNFRIDQGITQTNAGFENVNNRIDQKFNWLMGVMITMWVSLIITTLFK